MQALADDIKAAGLKKPIVTMPDGQLLDGRCRWDACDIAGVEQETRLFGSDPNDGDDPWRFVIRENALRRQMDDTDRAFTAQRMVTQTHGGSRKVKLGHPNLITIKEAASKFNVSTDLINYATALLRYGAAHVIKMVQEEKTLELFPAQYAVIPSKDKDKKTLVWNPDKKTVQSTWKTLDDVKQAADKKRSLLAELHEAASKSPETPEADETPGESTGTADNGETKTDDTTATPPVSELPEVTEPTAETPEPAVTPNKRKRKSAGAQPEADKTTRDLQWLVDVVSTINANEMLSVDDDIDLEHAKTLLPELHAAKLALIEWEDKLQSRTQEDAIVVAPIDPDKVPDRFKTKK